MLDAVVKKLYRWGKQNKNVSGMPPGSSPEILTVIPVGIPFGISPVILAGILPGSFPRILPEMPLVNLLGNFLKIHPEIPPEFLFMDYSRKLVMVFYGTHLGLLQRIPVEGIPIEISKSLEESLNEFRE